MKPLVLAVALALGATSSLCVPAATAAPGQQAERAAPAWVERSNALAQILLDAQGPFQPEETGFFGVPGTMTGWLTSAPTTASATAPR